MTSAGIVKMTPDASDVPADPPVCTMLFSRMPPPPSAFRTAIATTADGIAEGMVKPANRPRYEFAAARTAARITARTMARTVSWGAVCADASVDDASCGDELMSLFPSYAVGDNFETHRDSIAVPAARVVSLRLSAQRLFEHGGQGLQ